MNALLDAGIAALGLYCTLSTLRFLRTARRVQGTLVGYRSQRDDEGSWLHQPVFRFVDAHGRTITKFNPQHIWVVRRLRVGQSCTLLFNPANPEQVLRDSWLDLWLLPAVLIAVSALALLHALGV